MREGMTTCPFPPLLQGKRGGQGGVSGWVDGIILIFFQHINPDVFVEKT